MAPATRLLLALSVLLLATVADAEPAQQPAEVVAELDAVIPQVVAANKKAKLDPAALRAEALDIMSKPHLDIDAGRTPFDDGSNRSFIEKLEQQLLHFKAEPSPVMVYLLREHRRTPLKGNRLELLARLMSGQMKRALDSIGPKKPRG